MIPFSPPRIDDKIVAEVVAALRSGWITTGPRVKLFEERLAAYTGTASVLAVNSCTAGLELALRWFGIGPGDEVIVPAYTYAATANVVVHCGATPVLVDSGPDTNITAEHIRKAATKRTKAIIPVDIGGWPCDYDSILQMVNDASVVSLFTPSGEIQRQLGRILVLSDAAHSLGAIYKGNKTGTRADITAFSFHAVKNLTTSEGGAIAFNLPPPFDNTEIYRHFRIKALHGQTKDAFSKLQGTSWRYDILEAGYKYNMPDVLAAIGLVELERYDNDTLPRRRAIFEHYDRLLRRFPLAELPLWQDNTGTTSFHVYMLRFKGITESQRDEIIAHMHAMGIMVNVHFVPLPMMSFYKQQGYDIGDYPVAYDLYSREISLPVYYDLTGANVEEVVAGLEKAVSKTLG